MTYNKKTAQYGDAVFNTGDVMRINTLSHAWEFSDCIVVGFGSGATGTLYAKLARPYCFISQGSVLTGIEFIEMVTLSSLTTNYTRMATGRTI
jgi:hypothetical protein